MNDLQRTKKRANQNDRRLSEPTRKKNASWVMPNGAGIEKKKGNDFSRTHSIRRPPFEKIGKTRAKRKRSRNGADVKNSLRRLKAGRWKGQEALQEGKPDRHMVSAENPKDI